MSARARDTQDDTSADRIEKTVVLRAPRSRLWRAIANAEEFGAWFRMNLEGEFAEGRTIRGKITLAGYDHLTVEMLVERINPERHFLLPLASLRHRPSEGLK